MIEKGFLRNTSKGDVYSYILDNGKGLKAEILNLGGIVRRLIFDGVDVVLGRDDYQKYTCDPCYFGAIIGRNSNRIENCTFKINGKKYKNSPNDCGRDNSLHGGKNGFNTKFWDIEEHDGEEPQIILKTFSADGEEGFPANACVTIAYTLTKDNAIKIHYEGEADGDTIMNLTNHSYFNLNGHNSGDIKGHILWLNCNFYTPITKNLVPDGRVLSALDTAFDFTIPKKIGKDINSTDEQIELAEGYDHNFVINDRGMRKFAVLEGDTTGIKMEAFTDRPSVQFHTGNWIDDAPDGKDGAVYGKYQGLCLEAQVFPNFTKYSHFPDGYLNKGEKYDTVTEYRFSKITK